MWSDQTLLKEDRTTAAGRVAQELARRIADGTLPPGSKLPGETVLARRLGVSRPTLREAIRTLAARKLLRIRPRSGTYVATTLPAVVGERLEELVAADPARVWELLEIRRVVDTAAAELAARRRTPADLAEIGGLAAWFRDLDGSDLVLRPRWGQAYTRFFSLLARATHNTLFSHLAENVWSSLPGFPDSVQLLASQAETGAELRDQILAIYEAVEAGDPEATRRVTGNHLHFLERALRNLGRGREDWGGGERGEK